MEHTLTLRLTNTPARQDIARQAAVGIALRVGLPALAADRAAAAIAQAVAHSSDPVLTVQATISDTSALIVLSGVDPGWRRAAVSTLAALGATEDDDGVSLRLQRTPLHAV
jgi:hypothetical protein